MRAKTLLLTMLFLATGMLSWSSAQAGGIRIGIGIPIGVVVRPAYPPRYYYYGYPYYPAPVYVQPVPAYVTPPAYVPGTPIYQQSTPALQQSYYTPSAPAPTTGMTDSNPSFPPPAPLPAPPSTPTGTGR